MAITGGLALEALVSSCTTITFKEEAPVIYPPLKGHKVQPPENGCYIGFHPFKLRYPDYYKRRIGQMPKIFIPYYGRMDSPRPNFLTELVESISDQGAIPFVYIMIDTYIGLHGFKNLVDNKEFREDLTKYARDIVKFGKPIFVCTMHELNGDWYVWGQQPKTAKKVWKDMWQIFEDNGANEYATWVWEVFCQEASSWADYPERYYPGDNYVDWIGLSAYSRDGNPSGTKSFSLLAGSTYREMRWKHRNKPIMMAEFAKTYGSYQARWLKKAFKTIKSCPGMKAAVFWNNYHLWIDDLHTLTDNSFGVYKEIMKDPHFIGAG